MSVAGRTVEGMEAQLPHTCGDLSDRSGAVTPAELRAVGAALWARLAELRERDRAVPEELWRAAERFQPLLDGIDPEPGEGEELWELALTLPRLLARAEAERAVAERSTVAERSAVSLLVRDGVEHVEPRGA